MSKQPNNELIDENEIRAALRRWRPDPMEFATAVQNIVDDSKTLERVNHQRNQASEASSDSNQSQVAASIAPFHLLIGGTGLSSTKTSFATLSLANKIFAVLAMPIVCFLMIGLTAIGMMRIRSAQKGQKLVESNLNQQTRATKDWWRRYRWIAVPIYVATLLAPFVGWMTPLLILLFCSGVALVSIVRQLAKENLADRIAIGSNCLVGLVLLGQLTTAFAANVGEHWLDQHLVTAVLFAGAFLLAAFVRPTRLFNETSSRAVRLGFLATLLTIGIVLVGFFSQSLWRPLSTADMRSYVESLESRSTANWNSMQVPLMWMNETGKAYDREKLRAKFEQDRKSGAYPRTFMLTIGVRTRLIDAADLVDSEEVLRKREQLLSSALRDRPITSLDQHYYKIAAMASAADFDDSERDLLAARLIATLDYFDTAEADYMRLEQALLITELLELIERPIQLQHRTDVVHRWLVALQIDEPRLFQLTGGFGASTKSLGCDPESTIAALQLMERYGAPDSIDWSALRSYLRPGSSDHFLIDQSVITKVGRERLNALPDAPRPTIVDYLKREVPLWLSMLLVALAVYATLSAPNIKKDAPRSH